MNVDAQTWDQVHAGWDWTRCKVRTKNTEKKTKPITTNCQHNGVVKLCFSEVCVFCTSHPLHKTGLPSTPHMACARLAIRRAPLDVVQFVLEVVGDLHVPYRERPCFSQTGKDRTHEQGHRTPKSG